jgi:regulator of cell morphogenesis and NO signaling
MTTFTTRTVREIAVASPEATRIFEELKIDYCCGGQRPLAAACADAGLETGAVVRRLEEAARTTARPDGAADFQTAPLADLIRHIVDTHHAFTRRELVRLDALLDKVCSVHGQNHRELLEVRSLFRELANDLTPHMMKEEVMLFPYVAQLEAAARDGRPAPRAPFGTVRNPIRMMAMEHDTAGDLLRRVRAAAGDFVPPADVCISYQTLYGALEGFEADLHRHIHLENNILFPRAVELEDAALAA